MVSRIPLEDSTVALHPKKSQGDQSVFIYQTGNPGWFYQDFDDLVIE